jgi:ATP-dependent Clp protease ATP-binding subunit ClpB
MSVPTPRWLTDLERLLPIRSQFVVSGSIRDSFLVPLSSGPALAPLLRAVWESLKAHGYTCMLVFDPADGLRVYPDEHETREQAERLFDLKLAGAAGQGVDRRRSGDVRAEVKNRLLRLLVL